MTQRSRTYLKGISETGDAADQTLFEDLIDSAANLTDDAISNEVVSTNVRADKKRFPTTKVTQSGALTFTSVSAGAINGYGEVKVVTCDGTDITLTGGFTNYSSIPTTAGQTIVITFVWNSSLSEYMVSVDPPGTTAVGPIVTIIEQDNFTGTTIDSTLWPTVTNTAEITISQNNELIFAANGGVSSTLGIVLSKTISGANWFQVDIVSKATPSGQTLIEVLMTSDFCGIYTDDINDNEIQWRGTGYGPTNSGINIVGKTVGFLMSGNDVSLYYWNSGWTQILTTETITVTSDKTFRIRQANYSGEAGNNNFDNFFACDSQPSTQYPS